MKVFLLLLHSEFDLSGKRANSFSLFHQITTNKISVINGGCQLTPSGAWALAVFGNITLGCGNPDGIELFIKSASRLFFRKTIQRNDKRTNEIGN